MDRRQWLLVLLVGFGCLGAAPPARAQTGIALADGRNDIDQKRARSHASIPSAVFGPEQAREFLADRLRGNHELAELQKNFPALEALAKQLLQNPDRFPLGPREREILQRLKQGQTGWGGTNGPDLNNPAWQRLLGRILDRQQQGPVPGLEVSPEQLDAWKKLLDLPGGFGPAPGDGPANGPAFGPRGGRPVQPDRPGGFAAQPPGRPFGPALPSGGRVESQPSSWLNVDRLRSWGETLSQQEAVRNSGALQNAVRDLARRVLAEGESGSEKAAASLSEYLHLNRYLPNNNWQPNTSWLPRVNPGTFQPPSGFTVNRPDVGVNPGSLWDLVVWVVLFAVLGLAAWRLRAWHQAQRSAAAAAWQPGPWPIAPGAIATREQLIQAFEYLSLLRFGRAAFTWNHLEIAGHLAEGADSAAAAQRLAALYEQARYAPLDGPMTAAELAVARRDLCYLAGAPAA
jgi:hypothetical protein